MLKNLTLILLTLFCGAIFISHWFISQQLITQGSSAIEPRPKFKAASAPDFTAIKNIKQRKKSFFAYFSPIVEANNQQILNLRARIENNTLSEHLLLQLAKSYRIKTTDIDKIRTQLLIKIDYIPSSLVLAQGAIESAWGSSRFALDGNNYFGQWCFRKGCGLVPQERQDGKAHEVRVFKSPQLSVISYMKNINSHPAYRDLRKIRQQMRLAEEPYSGCRLARELKSYSQKGQSYVESLKQLIRSNKLETDPKGYCKKSPVQPKPQPKAKAEPKTQAESVTQPEQKSN